MESDFGKVVVSRSQRPRWSCLPSCQKTLIEHGPHHFFHEQLLNTHVALEQLLNTHILLLNCPTCTMAWLWMYIS